MTKTRNSPAPARHRPAQGVTFRRAALRAAITGASSVVATGVAATAVAAIFARRVVTPTVDRPADVEVLAVSGDRVTLRASPDTTAPGRYGLWLDGGRGHARLGGVVDQDEAAGTVVRTLTGIDSGTLRPGPARWNQYYFAGTPTSALGLTHQDVAVPAEGGPLPAWLVPPAAGRGTGGWAILVHGRGATREECLRAVPVLHKLGFTALVISYRSTAGLPRPAPGSASAGGSASSRHGRYHLGDTEWLDVEAAIVFAAERGATEVILIGWSMGGAIVLQTVSRSWTADRVRGVVLDAPVIDWRHVLAHQAKINHVPWAIGRLGQSMLSHRSGWRLAGTQAPVDLDRLDWLTRSAELTRPLLLIHSEDDEYVPFGPSRELAAARPDLITLVPFKGARHTKEWNVAPEVWENVVARFLLRV